MKESAKRIPVLRDVARPLYRFIRALAERMRRFRDSGSYWERRYATGGDSGKGSYGEFSEFKAEVVNSFVSEHRIQSVIEFGCGDGNQLGLLKNVSYLGLDVSRTAIASCREKYVRDTTKTFALLDDYEHEKADLAISLDVVYHLVEDDVFEDYMEKLFRAAERFVIVYSTDTDDNPADRRAHVRHRKFTDWIRRNRPDWRLVRHVPNRIPSGHAGGETYPDFFIYARAE